MVCIYNYAKISISFHIYFAMSQNPCIFASTLQLLQQKLTCHLYNLYLQPF